MMQEEIKFGCKGLSDGTEASYDVSTKNAMNAKRETDTQHLADIEVIYATAPVGLCVLDAELRYVRINESLAQINGLPISEHIGRTIKEVVPEISPQLEKAFEEIRRTKSRLLHLEVYGETPANPGIKCYWFVNFHPLLDSNGEILGFNLMVKEITDNKRIETELRHSEQRFRSLIEATSQIIWDTLADGELVSKQPGWSAFTGQTFDEYKGWGWLNAIHPDDRAHTTQAWSNALANCIFYEVEHRLRRYDGEYRHMSVRAIPIFKSDGGIREWIGVNTDITDRKKSEVEREQLLARSQQAQREAEAANHVKDEFLAVLSHELRSPLNPILGWSKILQTHKLTPEKTAEALKIIERNSKLQAQLIDDLLDVSQILQGKLSLNVTSINLESTIYNALETIRLAAEAKSIDLVCTIENSQHSLFDEEFQHIKSYLKSYLKSQLANSQLPNSQLQVIGDSTRLQQVVWNLLSNAVKFTPPGGRVEVRLEKVDKYAQIKVIDTGKGINREFLPYVFEYFRQADSATTRKFGGLGLGLAIVKQLVELHGGIVNVESLGEGQGSTFIVQLPLLETHKGKKMQGRCSEIDPNLRNFEGIKILVVDDDNDSLDFVLFILEQEGAIVTPATSAFEALEVLTNFIPDILVSDIAMPEMDGYALMRQVRLRAGLPKAIALTAYAGEYEQQQALAAGFQMHISKPIDPEELITLIAQLLTEEVVT